METASPKGVSNQPVAEEFARAEARSCLNATLENSIPRARLLLCLPRGFGWHNDLPRSALVSDCDVIRVIPSVSLYPVSNAQVRQR